MKVVPLYWKPPTGDDYWSRARLPFTCLIFIAPLLIAYEFGVQELGAGHPELLRNGADHWMRSGLSWMGITQFWVLPVLLVVGLLAWQIRGQYSWKIGPETLVGMAAESLLFAICLIVVGQLQDLAFQHCESIGPLRTGGAPTSNGWSRAISFLGAGIYEETLFRLCLLPVCYGLLRLLLLPPKWAAGFSVPVTALVFAAAHYIGPAADPYTVFSFTFRTLAGLLFATLFLLRGFGVAVGCHALYDILVGVVLEFSR
ncbi:MAG TPA: CPBP family intramembrane glutamic endopeptidase [Planctomycetaceae bacterium]|nr:CPBP family intramembrane glutamic endopeptidase [Planctomycetaceae bacterium]